MGLFSRTNHNDPENEQFDEVDLPGSTDLNTDPFIDEDAPLDLDLGAEPESKPARLSYGIEQAIRLMKSLPRDNNEVVVTVVKKTLESTDIQVQDIIADAGAKEERLRAQHKQLEAEIKRFQEEISQRNQTIADLLQELKETSDVRQRLELAVKLEAGRAEKEARNKQAVAAAKNAPRSGVPGSAQAPGKALSSPAGSGDSQSALAGSLADLPGAS
jgi:hypothetical protein